MQPSRKPLLLISYNVLDQKISQFVKIFYAVFKFYNSKYKAAIKENLRVDLSNIVVTIDLEFGGNEDKWLEKLSDMSSYSDKFQDYLSAKQFCTYQNKIRRLSL